jgi:hypothetical protein
MDPTVSFETFLPSSLPPWLRKLVAVLVIFHAAFFLLYVALLCCAPAPKPLPKIPLREEKDN